MKLSLDFWKKIVDILKYFEVFCLIVIIFLISVFIFGVSTYKYPNWTSLCCCNNTGCNMSYSSHNNTCTSVGDINISFQSMVCRATKPKAWGVE